MLEEQPWDLALAVFLATRGQVRGCREGAPQSAEAIAEPMASLGGPHTLLVWLLLLQPWLTEASEDGSATSLPPPAPSGGDAKNRTVAQPPLRGASEVPKLVEFSLGDSQRWASGGAG